MQKFAIALCCCILLMAADAASAEISDVGKQVIKSLRQKHQSAGAEHGFKNLAETLRAKHAPASPTEELPRDTATPFAGGADGTVCAKPMGTNSILLAGSDSQSSTLENSNASESSENGCYGETVLPAEKYDCVRYPTEPAAKQMTASSDSPTSQNKSDATFSGFIGAVFALMALFSAGSAMAGSSGKGDVGVVGIIGILMVVAAMILGFATAIKFWPFLLLLFFCTMFDSKRGSSGSGCGCGCGLLLLLLMLGLL